MARPGLRSPIQAFFHKHVPCQSLRESRPPDIGPAVSVGNAELARIFAADPNLSASLDGDIGPAFYGLRTTILTLLLMALLRIKRPEALKEHAPPQLGRELARRRVAAHGAAMGFLYADGHVRVYHGKHAIPKAHVARMRISMPGTTDY